MGTILKEKIKYIEQIEKYKEILTKKLNNEYKIFI